MFRLSIPFVDSYFLVTPQWAGLHPAVQGGLLALVCLVPLALVLWLYRYELKLVPAPTALGLLSLRLVALFLILGLVCLQPIYAFDRTTGLPGRVLVAVDRSDSMDVADPQRPALDTLRLARALKLGEGLCSDAQLAGWVRDYEQNGSPRWLTPEEEQEGPQRREGLRKQRKQAHNEVCARVDRLTRTEAARRILGAEGVRLLPALAEKHQVELLGFHSESWDLEPGKLDELFRRPGEAARGEKDGRAAGTDRSDGSGEPSHGSAAAFTDLRLPLVRALERSGSGQGKVLGVVVLTDGQHNAGEGPAAKARELGERQIPVYPIALGARKPPPDVAVISVRAPSAVFKDVDATVDVRFRIAGLPAQDFLVELHRDGKEKKLLAERTVRHDGKDREYTESFPVRMDEAGTQTLVATVRPVHAATKETCTDNNSRSTTVNVADDKIKVLLVDGEARWEYHYLASALQRDRTMQTDRVVFLQPRLNERLTPKQLDEMGSPRQALPEGPDALSGYDCILLGDVSPEQLPLAERVRLERYVADRGGTLVLLAGKRSMPLAFPETLANGESDPLRKLLPVEVPHVEAPAGGFPVTLTQAGKETRFLDLDPEGGKGEEIWAGLPRHYWAVVGQAKPGATPLAFLAGDAADRKALREREKQRGLMVRHNYGFGRVLYVGLDSTWRWRFKVGDLYHHRFWGQAIRQAASDKPLVTGNEFVRFGTPQPLYRTGQDQEVEVVARLNESLGALKSDLAAGARILRQGGPEGKEQAVALVPLARRPAQPRVLEGKVRGLPPGRYAIELVIPDLADKLKAPAADDKPLRASFTVLPPDSREMVDLETRWPLLEEVAVKSGGQVYAPEEAADLLNRLVNQAVAHAEHHEQRLWQWWVMLAVVVGLLTVEWAGRKLAGLP